MKLTGEMRDLLARAAVMAEGTAMQWDKGGNKSKYHSKPGSTVLSFHGRSTLDEMRQRFERCNTESDQAKAVAWAKAELDSLAGVNRPKPIPERTRILREWENYTDAEASKVTGVSRTTVRRWREQDGRDPRDGKRYSRFDARSRKAA